MSTQVADLITLALLETGDPGGLRTTRPQMLSFYNRIHRRVASETKTLEVDSSFDIVAGQSRYSYPDDCVVIKGIRYSLTPTDPHTFVWLEEKFNDEFRLQTTRLYPTGTVWGYFASPQMFELIGEPSTAIPGGAILRYARVPALVLSETGAFMELPDFHSNFVQDGMMILSRMSGRERTAAQQDLKNWTEELAELRDKMTDRSDDRRPALRPTGAVEGRFGQV